MNLILISKAGLDSEMWSFIDLTFVSSYDYPS